MVVVVGLGPGSLERLPESYRLMLADPSIPVIVRTLNHPAAAELAALRPVESCDDLYDDALTFEDVYDAVAERVIAAARRGPTIYAVPGSPLVGELAVSRIQQRIDTRLLPSESFVDAVLAAVGYDPLDRGLRIINGHRLPEPLLIDGPTVIAQLDVEIVLSEVVSALGRILSEQAEVTMLVGAGDREPQMVTTTLDRVDLRLAGLRTSMFLDPEPGGLVGVIRTMARLRRDCPWDLSQTHESLVKNLIEESYELIEAISELPDSLGQVEDELGDVLLQVLFHSVIASESGGFGIEDVAENLRQKLVRRHPHVFGEVEVDSVEQVKANWQRIKEEEKGDALGSALIGVPAGMPGLERATNLQRKAAAVGFDWSEVEPVLAKVHEELDELTHVMGDPDRRREELGDVLFSVVNLARHLEVDPELAMAGAIGRFVRRFEAMEAMGSLAGLTPEEMDARWELAKKL
jgi:tetrapyrrole methylase family protein/MazG family protein